MGCSFCRGHAGQVCSRPGCGVESDDIGGTWIPGLTGKPATNETECTIATMMLVDQWRAGKINLGEFQYNLRAIVRRMG